MYFKEKKNTRKYSVRTKAYAEKDKERPDM